MANGGAGAPRAATHQRAGGKRTSHKKEMGLARVAEPERSRSRQRRPSTRQSARGGGAAAAAAAATALLLCCAWSPPLAVHGQPSAPVPSAPAQDSSQWGPYETSPTYASDDDEHDSLYQSVDEANLAPPAPEFDFPIAQTTRIKYTSAFLSNMWGVAGERFSYTGRMSDWSWAGYKMGEEPIPNLPAMYNLVTDFGARPDDNVADTAAFQAAFTRVPPGGVLFIPAGRFIVDKKLARTTSIVIRGAGRGQTIIFFSKCLNDFSPWTLTAANPLSPYRDQPYLITLQGTLSQGSSTLVGSVAADARRGASTVQVTLAAGTQLYAGMVLRFVASDRNLALVSYMYGNMTEADMRRPATDVLNANNLLTFNSRLRSWRSAGGGATVLTLDRPLALDLRPSAWRNVQVHEFPTGSMLTETGVEDLTFQFKDSTYPGHLIENGYNTLGVFGCYNCWFRRLGFLNIDIGLHVENSAFVTIDDLDFGNSTDRSAGNLQKFDGHHAVRLARTTDVLARNLAVKCKYIHDLTVDVSAILNVYHNVTGTDLSLDHHSRAPTMNLFSRLNCGRCMRTWASGGSATSGAHAGMLNMVWGLTGRWTTTYIEPMWLGFGASYTIVGAPLSRLPNYNNILVEAVDPNVLLPWDLQASQLQWRLSRAYASSTGGAAAQVAQSAQEPVVSSDASSLPRKL